MVWLYEIIITYFIVITYYLPTIFIYHFMIPDFYVFTSICPPLVITSLLWSLWLVLQPTLHQIVILLSAKHHRRFEFLSEKYGRLLEFLIGLHWASGVGVLIHVVFNRPASCSFLKQYEVMNDGSTSIQVED